MAKVIKVEADHLVIVNDDQSVEKVTGKYSTDSVLSVGDEVQVYKLDNEYIINKVKPAAPQGQVVINNQVLQQTSKVMVNKVAYALLAFFLGAFGFHKFYAGKIGLGILYLVFFWTAIPGIVAFIEFIIALTKNADENGNIPV